MRHLVHPAGFPLPATSQDAGVTVAHGSSHFTKNKSAWALCLHSVELLRVLLHKTEVSIWVVEQLQPQAGDRSFASAGSTVFFPLSSLAPTRRSPAPSNGRLFCPLLLQHDLEALTPSEFCQVLVEGILCAHEGRPGASDVSVTEPRWSRVGACRNVVIRSNLYLKVNNVPRVPAFFDTSARLNHLVPSRPTNTASPKEPADQQAVGGMRHPARAIARPAGMPIGHWVQSRGCWSHSRQYQGCEKCGGTVGWWNIN